MLKTILQTAASKPTDEVCIEVPVAQVRNPCYNITGQYYTATSLHTSGVELTGSDMLGVHDFVQL